MSLNHVGKLGLGLVAVELGGRLRGSLLGRRGLEADAQLVDVCVKAVERFSGVAPVDITERNYIL